MQQYSKAIAAGFMAVLGLLENLGAINTIPAEAEGVANSIAFLLTTMLVYVVPNKGKETPV